MPDRPVESDEFRIIFPSRVTRTGRLAALGRPPGPLENSVALKPALVALLLLPMVAARGPSACLPRLEFPGYTVIQLVPGADIEFQVRENR